MPVLIKVVGGGLVPKRPEEATAMFKFKIDNSGWPDWRDDPVYDLKKRHR